jgi:tRNA G37 N-methylase Trm5
VPRAGTRDSRATLLLGGHGLVSHREGGVVFSMDVTACMFSSGAEGLACGCDCDACKPSFFV